MHLVFGAIWQEMLKIVYCPIPSYHYTIHIWTDTHQYIHAFYDNLSGTPTPAAHCHSHQRVRIVAEPINCNDPLLYAVLLKTLQKTHKKTTIIYCDCQSFDVHGTSNK